MDWAVYLFYRAAVAVVSALPLRLIFFVGRSLGTLAWLVARPYRALVLRNLNIAFGAEKSPRELRQLGREHLATLGANVFCSVKLAAMTHGQVARRVRWENLAGLEAALSADRGVIGAISHLGAWELFAQMPHFLPQHRFSTIYQKLGNAFIDADVRRARGRSGVRPFERQDGFNAPLQFLREGGGLAVLVDQHAGDKGLWTPFFGRLASTSPLAATLALRTGAAVVPVALYTDGVARWRFVVGAPIETAAATTEELTAKINRSLEQQIRVSPRDWFWVHNRWKTPCPKFLLAHYKRGVSLPEDFPAARLQPFRILIRAPNWLGDAVMTVPAVRAIKRGRPDARVTVLTRAKLADFWETVSEVDEVIAIERDDRWWRVARKIGRDFDVAILLPNSLRAALEVWLAGVPRRAGYRGRRRSWLLNQIVAEPDSKRPPRHQVHHYLDLARSLGAPVDDFFPAASSQNSKTKIRHCLGLCPGAEYGAAKRWLPERFAEVAQRVSKNREVEWVLFGVEKDREIGAQIAAALDGKCENLIGQTTLAQLIERLRECRLLLTNDTGTMHLAAHLGVPVIAIFGSTEPALTGPLGARSRVLRHHVVCSPCFLRECPLDFRCMNAVSVDEVMETVLAEL